MEQENQEGKWKRFGCWLGRNWGKLLIFILLGSFITTYIITPDRLDVSDKYEIFLNLLLIILAFLGVAGYGTYKWVERRLDERLQISHLKEEQEIENSRNLFNAEAQRHMGYIFWELFEVEKIREKSQNTSDSYTERVSKKFIDLAIETAKFSLEFAGKLPENEYKVDILGCKNNLLYFLAETATFEGFEFTEEDKKLALKLTNEILAEESKQGYPKFKQDYPKNYYQFLESCAWALQHLSEKEDSVSKQKALDIIRKLLNEENIPFRWRKKIKKKWWAYILAEKRLPRNN